MYQEAAALQSRRHHMVATHLHNIAGDLGAVHSLFAGLDLQSRHLLIGDVLESFRQEVHAVLQVIAAQALPEIVECTQVEIALV